MDKKGVEKKVEPEKKGFSGKKKNNCNRRARVKLSKRSEKRCRGVYVKLMGKKNRAQGI